MQTTASRRYLLAGALAGISSVAGLALASVVVLLLGLLWQYAFNRNLPIIGNTALGAAVEDVGRIPSFLWSWRWPLLGMGIAGVPLAYAERLARRSPYPWRDRIVGAGLLGVVGAALTTGLLATADQPLYDIRNQTSGLPTLAERQPAAWNLLLVAVLLALAISGAVWLLWSWWYARWRRWLHLADPAPAQEQALRTADASIAERRSVARIRALALIAAVASLALAAAGVAGFEAARAKIRSGDISADPLSPNVAVRLSLHAPERQLMVENTYGGGSASAVVLSASEQTPVSPPVELTFTSGQLGGERAALDVAGLPPGAYLLNIQLRSGEGVRVGYALLQSYAPLVPAASAVAGLGVGGVLGVGALLMGMAAEGRLRE
ncbi:MAG: hypothetical protein RLZZ387_1346 [Chloroflexota bacterium]